MTTPDEKRLCTLRRYQILDTTPEESFDAITRVASSVCRTSFSAISLFDFDRQYLKSEVGLGTSKTNLFETFCAYTITQNEILIVNDALGNPHFCADKMMAEEPQFRFFAGCALRAADGTALGALCVLDSEPRPSGLTFVERSTLEVLARQVEAHLELRLAVRDRETQFMTLQQLTQDLEYAGEHDPLTRLPNRALFIKRLNASIRDCDLNQTSMALMLIDVDHFKQINDTLGHDAGDALLRDFAANLAQVVRSTDTIARIGGDEFAMILTGFNADNPVRTAISEIVQRISSPVRHRRRHIQCRASIGVAVYPQDARGAGELAKCSDLALRAAKRTRGKVVNFEQHLLEEFDGEVKSVRRVHAAVQARAFAPFYQPKIDLITGERAGFEALLRWKSPAAVGSVFNVFDPNFPDGALVSQIGRLMIDLILDDAQRWIAKGIDFGHLAINSCAVDFAGDDFGERLLEGLHQRKISTSLVELEVTEGVLVGRGASHVARAMSVLRGAGVKIALDDFGTGYASLTHLKQFPVDVIKIDKSFISGITESPDDAAIVRAVIGLAKNLGIATVAEGIETVSQAAYVRHHGCDLGQGFLYGAAISAGEVESNEFGTEFAVA